MCTIVKPCQNRLICSKNSPNLLNFLQGAVLRLDPSPAYFVAFMQWIPRIHLWCDTCWVIGGQCGDHRVFHKRLAFLSLLHENKKKSSDKTLPPVGIEPSPTLTYTNLTFACKTETLGSLYSYALLIPVQLSSGAWIEVQRSPTRHMSS